MQGTAPSALPSTPPRYAYLHIIPSNLEVQPSSWAHTPIQTHLQTLHLLDAFVCTNFLVLQDPSQGESCQSPSVYQEFQCPYHIPIFVSINYYVLRAIRSISGSRPGVIGKF